MEEKRNDIIRKAIGQVENASNEICDKNREAARDSCIKALVLVDLVIEMDPCCVEDLSVCKALLDLSARQLAKMVSHQLHVDTAHANTNVGITNTNTSSTTTGHANSALIASTATPESTSSSGALPPSNSDATKSLETAVQLSNVSEPFLRVSFDDIIGCETAKQLLYESIVLPLSMTAVRSKSSGDVDNGEQRDLLALQDIFQGIRGGVGNVLLHGPPGTGKTLLAQAAAQEAGAVMIEVRPSDVLSKYQGESERYLKEVFAKARQLERCVIFFDEFDSIGATRGGGDDGLQARRLLSELLIQMSLNKQLIVKRQQLQRQFHATTTDKVFGLAVNSRRGDTSTSTDAVAAAAAVKRKLSFDEEEVNRTINKSIKSHRHNFDTGEEFGSTSTMLASSALTTIVEGCADGCINNNNSDESSTEAKLFCSKRQTEPASQSSSVVLVEEAESALYTAAAAAESGQKPQHQEQEQEEQKQQVVCPLVTLIAATNRLEDLDEAVLRRFETKVYVGVPNARTRMLMVEHHLHGINCEIDEEGLKVVASITAGWSGSDIEMLCKEAAMIPVRCILSYVNHQHNFRQQQEQQQERKQQEEQHRQQRVSSGGCHNGDLNKKEKDCSSTSTAHSDKDNEDEDGEEEESFYLPSSSSSASAAIPIIRPVLLSDFEEAYSSIVLKSTMEEKGGGEEEEEQAHEKEEEAASASTGTSQIGSQGSISSSSLSPAQECYNLKRMHQHHHLEYHQLYHQHQHEYNKW